MGLVFPSLFPPPPDPISFFFFFFCVCVCFDSIPDVLSVPSAQTRFTTYLHHRPSISNLPTLLAPLLGDSPCIKAAAR